MKHKIIYFGLALLTGLFIGLLISAKLDIFTTAESQTQNQGAPGSYEGFGMEDAIIKVANIAGKAVVSISTEHTTKIKGRRRAFSGQPFGGGSPFEQDEFFRRFFNDFYGDIPDREYKQIGLGSGVIIDKQGHILTNEHVINGADKISVRLPDGREFKAEIKGKDARSDLAVIKIQEDNLPVAELGDSNNLKIGQWVVAIGNPFAYAMQNAEPTVTAGVISALHRSLGRVIAGDRDYNDLVQTDAAINPGNSGGPLVNLKGEVIGINVAIYSTTGGYQGVGFAIPVNSAKNILSRLIAGKKITYGWLGVTVQDLSEDMAKYFGLSDKNGVLVAKVMPDGPAQKSEIKEGDVIKQFDNKPVNNVKELISIVGKTGAGSRADAVIIRDKKQLTVPVQVGERPENLESSAAAEEEVVTASAKWRGLEVQDLSPDTRRAFGYRIPEKEGIVVINVEPGSPAEEAGIIQGDIILEINKQAVKSAADYKKITSSVNGDCLVKTSRGYGLIKSEKK